MYVHVCAHAWLLGHAIHTMRGQASTAVVGPRRGLVSAHASRLVGARRLPLRPVPSGRMQVCRELRVVLPRMYSCGDGQGRIPATAGFLHCLKHLSGPRARRRPAHEAGFSTRRGAPDLRLPSIWPGALPCNAPRFAPARALGTERARAGRPKPGGCGDQAQAGGVHDQSTAVYHPACLADPQPWPKAAPSSFSRAA